MSTEFFSVASDGVSINIFKRGYLKFEALAQV